jgi:hypothetical protein
MTQNAEYGAQTGGCVEWEPPDDWDPTEAMMRSLLAKADGEPVNEDEVQLASMALCAQALIDQGIPKQLAMDMVEQAADHGTIHVTFSQAEGLNVTIGEDEPAQTGRTAAYGVTD